MKRLLIAMLLLFAGTAWATAPVTYYVRTDGNDANSGLTNTAGGALLTCAGINSKLLNAGDIVHFGLGTFGAAQNDTCLVVPSSGTAALPIIFEGEGSGTVITAARQISGWTNANQAANVYKRAKTVADSTYAVWVNNVLGTRVVTEATLDANREWITWPDSTKVYLTAVADTANIKRSKAWCITSSAKSYFTICNLRVTKGTGAISGGTNRGNINIATGTNIIIEKSQSDSTSNGSDIVTTAKYTTVRYCLFPSNVNRAIYAAADSGSAYNNTMTGTNTQYIILSTNIKDWIIKNNIFSGSATNFIWLTSPVTYIARNNLFYKSTGYTNGWRRGATSFSTLASWADSTGQESGSLTGDPLFRTGEYRPYPNGPGVNKGVAVGLTSDYRGRSIIGMPDIGAYEYHPSAIMRINAILGERWF